MPNLEERRLAALKVHILWAWLASHPGHDKREHPLYRALRIGQPYLECPWCELYRSRHDDHNCTDCPLAEVDARCTVHGSWYDCWKRNIPFQSGYSVEAGNIAGLAWQEYKRLGVENDTTKNKYKG